LSFEIKVEADATLKQFDAVTKNVADLAQETTTTFIAWQTEDMHRKFPKVDGDGLSVSTAIYPRSQLQRSGKDKRSRAKSIRQRSIVAASRTSPGNPKPILRPELFDKLKDRMVEMVKEAFTWE
jgi:hypothetical protein